MKTVFPKHLMVEVVAGFCPSRCIMCNIEHSPRKEIMGNDVFFLILEQFLPYKESLVSTTLHGLGEPLLDKNFVAKVELAKKMGFPSVGFATIAENLDDALAMNLIQAGLDTIIFSVDGIRKETHEAIRVGTDFDKSIHHIKNFIRRRNEFGNTKIIVRMITQDLNRAEWPAYLEYWSKRLKKKFGDQIGAFDVHQYDRKPGFDVKIKLLEMTKLGKVVCPDIYDRFFVYVDGSIGFCCAYDTCWYDLGNILHEDPVNIYNRGVFQHYRQAMEAAKIAELPHCSNCSVILCDMNKIYLDPEE